MRTLPALCVVCFLALMVAAARPAAPPPVRWEYAELAYSPILSVWVWQSPTGTVSGELPDLYRAVSAHEPPKGERLFVYSLVSAAGQQGWEMVTADREPNNGNPCGFWFKRQSADSR